MKVNLKYSVGTDISKQEFEACISVITNEQDVIVKARRKFNNSNEGIGYFLVWIKKHLKEEIPVVFTMEATGVYYEKLALALFENDYYVSVVLPNKSKKYMQSLGLKSKNDKIDAQGLSRMGAEQKLTRWMPFSKNIYQLRLLTRQNEDLQKQRTAMLNRKEAGKFSQYTNKLVGKQLGSMLKLIDKQIQQVK